jgi:hypothetical protein
MPEHSQAFLDNDVNGELATMLGAEELQEDLGIASAADRLKILTAIGKAALQPSNNVGRMLLRNADTYQQDLELHSTGSEIDQRHTSADTSTREQSDVNIVQQSLGVGKYRPAIGPIATALRAAALQRSSKDNTSAPATRTTGANADSAKVETEEVDTTDPHWWRFVSDVTMTTGPASADATAQLQLTALDLPTGVLPWEPLITSARPRPEVSEESASLLSSHHQTSVDKTGLLPRKPKEWERLLNSATIRDLRQAPDWESAGSPRGAGSTSGVPFAHAGGLGLQFPGPKKGRLSDVAKSVGRPGRYM